MKGHIANVLDLELNSWEIIEFGLTTINLKSREILKTYSIPISDRALPLDPRISELTGWTDTKLNKSGVPFHIACQRIKGLYGGYGRLLITDSEAEPRAITRHIDQRYMSLMEDRKKMLPFGKRYDLLNVSSLFKIKSGDFTNRSLVNMLNYCELEFEGKQHRASDDSLNIARLFLELVK